MTTYLLTEAQRDGQLHALSIPEHADEGENAAAKDMLQSLPMVSGEPVASVMGIYSDTSDEISVSLPRGMSLYASPQPLQPITADDVTDEMLDELNANTHPASTRAEILAAAYNAVLKHRL